MMPSLTSWNNEQANMLALIDLIRRREARCGVIGLGYVGLPLAVGRDFCLAFSPERIDPGNPHFKTRNIPKVVAGVTPQCTAVARTLYEQCVERVVAVSSPRVAEMVKLLENTFRSVNIALVNE